MNLHTTVVSWWRQRRAAAAAYRDGLDIIATLAAITAELPTLPKWRTAPAPVDGRCIRCGGARCRPWREGRDCQQDGLDRRPAYAAGLALPRDGRHSGAAAVLRWLAGDWGTTALPVATRRALGRIAGTARVPLVLAGGEVVP